MGSPIDEQPDTGATPLFISLPFDDWSHIDSSLTDNMVHHRFGSSLVHVLGTRPKNPPLLGTDILVPPRLGTGTRILPVLGTRMGNDG